MQMMMELDGCGKLCFSDTRPKDITRFATPLSIVDVFFVLWRIIRILQLHNYTRSRCGISLSLLLTLSIWAIGMMRFYRIAESSHKCGGSSIRGRKGREEEKRGAVGGGGWGV